VGAVGTALLRQVSGAHDWSDVLVGWGVGHAVGLFVSFVHPMVEVTRRDEATGEVRAGSAAARARPTLLTWSGAF